MEIENLETADQEIALQGENDSSKNVKSGGELLMAKKQKLIITLGILVLVMLLILLLLIGFKFGFWTRTPVSTLPPLSPSPVATAIPISSPSAYATDSAILKIEEEVRNAERDLQLTDLKESGLMPPSLDWEVRFEE